MAGNIKGITIEFDADASKLDKSLREINKNTKTIDKELSKVNNGLKFNPTSVELWRQKQTLLTQKIGETETKLKLLKDRQNQLDASKVDKNSQEYRELQREIITTESKLKTFKGQLQSVGNVKLRVASEQLKQIGSKATAAGQAMMGVSRAAGVVAVSIGALAVKSGSWADDLNTMSKQYRLSTKDLQVYSAAANLVDVDVNSIAKSHVKLTKNMKNAADGSEKQVEAFKALGVNITDANGDLRDTDEVWQETIKALGSMENETERDALAMQLMGGAARDLNPLIEDGGETYKKVSDTMKKYGLDFLDQKTLDKANQFNDELDTMKAVGLLAFQSLGAKIAEVLQPALAKLGEIVGKVAAWFGKLDPVIVTIIGAISGLVALIAPALLLFGALASAAGAVAGALAGISAPIIGIVAIIGALVAAFATAYASSESFRKVVNEIAKTIGKQLMSVVKAAISFFKQLFAVIADTATEIANQLAPVLKALMPVFKWIAAFLAGRLKNSFNLIIGVIKVLGAILKSAAAIFRGIFEAVGTLAIGAYRKIKGAFSKVKDAISGPFEKAKEIVSGVIEKIKGFFPIKIGNILSNLKLPHFSLDWGSKDFGPLGKISYPKGFHVDWYKNGGIFNKPTLLAGVGEAGPEAVVPLSGSQMQPFAKAISENMGGIDYDKLSACIVAAMMSVNSDVTIDVDGKKLANVTAPYMNTAINAIQRKQERKLGFAGV